jgi:putative ABC transport system permease protein
MRIQPDWANYLCMRVKAGYISRTIHFLENKWARFFPGYPFEYHFLDETIDRMYRGEHRVSGIINYFTLLAIFISCLGLFGLSSFTAEQRTREIGIRKVLGASVTGIVVLLSREFSRLVLVANCIAWPIAYFVMSKWLHDFAYRVPIEIQVFVLSGGITLVIALLTVSFQALRAATANPVEALKYE